MSQQLQITGGAKVRSLEGVITGSTGVLGSLPINGANGIPQLDSNGKILVSQLPNSVMEYKGTWNVTTNTPYLVNGTGNAGDVYLVEGAATGGTSHDFGAGAITFYNGDQVIYSGSIWQRGAGSSGTVTSVAITESGDALTITGSPITNSGTINIGFAGTSAQYVAGNGTLVTFPTITTEAQRLITEVYNETGATLTKGTVVYINGGHGNLPTIAKALATSDATSAQTYGVVQSDIGNNNNGFVVVIGSLNDLDTQAYANGTQLYLSSTTAGAWTSTKQYAPAHLVYVGIVTRSHPTQGVVEIKIQNGYELDELHNVSAQTPSNNDGLFYNSSNSLWENKSIATALGYTPVPTTRTLTINGTTYDLSADRSWTITAGVSGSGTTNYLSKWTGSTALGDSLLFDNGTNVGIGTASPSYKLDVNGTGRYSGALLVNPSNTAVVGLDVATNITRFRADSTVTTNPKFFSISTGSGTAVLFDVGGYGAYANTDMAFYTQNASTGPNSTPNLYLKSDGTVGIGTSTPTNKLSVAGTAAISGQLTLGDTITNGTYTYTLPGATGVLALTSDLSFYVTLGTLQTITGTKIYSSLQYFDNNVYIKHSISGSSAGYTTLGASASGLNINLASGTSNNSLLFASTSASNTYTFPNATGTIALTTDLSSYVPTSRTLTINGTTYDLSANRSWTISGSQWTTTGSNIYYNTGNVGIGTSSPSALLHLSQNTSNLNLYLQNTNGSGKTWSLNSDNAGKFNIHDTTANYFTINSAGVVGIGTTNPRLAGSGYSGIEISSSTSGSSIILNNSTNNITYIYTSNSGGDFLIENAGAQIFRAGSAERMRITSTGNVGIGTSDPQTILNGFSSSARGVAISNAYPFIGFNDTDGGNFYVGTQANIGYIWNFGSASTYVVSSSNGVYLASGATSWTANSDERLKNINSNIDNAVEKLMTLRTINFSWKSDKNNKENLGLIAQDVEKVFPQVIDKNKLSNVIDKQLDETEYLGVRYTELVPVLIKAIQELKAEIDELKNK